MAKYIMFITVDHRLDCTLAKVQVSRMGETVPVFTVEEPEFLSPRSCFNELLAAVEAHLDIARASKELDERINVDDSR